MINECLLTNDTRQCPPPPPSPLPLPPPGTVLLNLSPMSDYSQYSATAPSSIATVSPQHHHHHHPHHQMMKASPHPVGEPYHGGNVYIGTIGAQHQTASAYYYTNHEINSFYQQNGQMENRTAFISHHSSTEEKYSNSFEHSNTANDGYSNVPSTTTTITTSAVSMSRHTPDVVAPLQPAPTTYTVPTCQSESSGYHTAPTQAPPVSQPPPPPPPQPSSSTPHASTQPTDTNATYQQIGTANHPPNEITDFHDVSPVSIESGKKK